MKKRQYSINSILYLGILFFLVILAYVLFKKVLSNTLSLKSLIVYVGTPSCFIVLFIYMLRMKDNVKINFIIVSCSLIVSLYFCESTLYYRDLSKSGIVPNAAAAKKNGKHFDTRTRLEILSELNEKGIRSSLSFSPRQFTYMSKPGLIGGITIDSKLIIPLGSVSHAVIPLDNEGGEWTYYNSDEYGFNNPKGLYEQGLDIVALGDSFIEGTGVTVDKNSVALIRKKCKKTLALGKSGNGPLAMLGTFREYVKPLQPKIVLWYYYEENDLQDLKYERETQLVKYMNKEYRQGLQMYQKEIDEKLLQYCVHVLSEKKKEANDKRNYAVSLAPRVFIKNIFLLSRIRERLTLKENPFKEKLPLCKQILEQIKDSTDAWGGKLYVVYLPAHASFIKDLTQQQRDTLFNRKEVLNCLASLKIPVIDVYEAFKTQGDPLSNFPFRLRNHYNERGYQIVADEIIKELQL
ncbi:MAG: hypothetical protein KKH94_08620 [Candidatus Omnitrophica bacterium]|nr:hypothetical protein [Candidatus Omnitrophota bacterium]